MRPQKIDLRNVTLCSVDCLNPVLASRALDLSRNHCDFGDALLLTDRHIDCNARLALIPAIDSKEAYSTFMLKELNRWIDAPWALVIQWDGYVLDSASWTDEYFNYDYVGARWPCHQDGMTVGNGGFSLRSKRLLVILAGDRRFQPDPDIPEDVLIGRHFRPTLEAEYGIRFAPEHLADRFSVEMAEIEGPTFGFHGIFNMHRLLGDDELQHMVRHVHPRTVDTGEFVGFCFRCLEIGRTSIGLTAYARLREYRPAHVIEDYLAHNGYTHSEAAQAVAICESVRHLDPAIFASPSI